MLQCVVVCCNILQRVVACFSVLQCVLVHFVVLATPQCRKFSGGQYTPSFYRRLTILNPSTMSFPICIASKSG